MGEVPFGYRMHNGALVPDFEVARGVAVERVLAHISHNVANELLREVDVKNGREFKGWCPFGECHGKRGSSAPVTSRLLTARSSRGLRSGATLREFTSTRTLSTRAEAFILSEKNRPLFEAWNREDPVDAWKCERDRRVGRGDPRCPWLSGLR